VWVDWSQASNALTFADDGEIAQLAIRAASGLDSGTEHPDSLQSKVAPAQR
jgi:hypothetical protein